MLRERLDRDVVDGQEQHVGLRQHVVVVAQREVELVVIAQDREVRVVRREQHAYIGVLRQPEFHSSRSVSQPRYASPSNGGFLAPDLLIDRPRRSTTRRQRGSLSPEACRASTIRVTGLAARERR